MVGTRPSEQEPSDQATAGEEQEGVLLRILDQPDGCQADDGEEKDENADAEVQQRTSLPRLGAGLVKLLFEYPTPDSGAQRIIHLD